MDVALLVNPLARSGVRSGAVDDAARLLRAAGAHVRILEGRDVAEGTALLRRALDAGVDAVLIAGGDGTVNVAVQELAGSRVPLGVIPVGTGNDFAGSLGLRERRAEATVAALLETAPRTIDLARVTRADGSTRLFATVLASGFDANVNDRANAMRWPRGRSRYTLAILTEFLRLNPVTFRIDVETEDGGRENLDGRHVLAAIANGPTYGGGIPIAPAADLADGLLDLTLIRPTGRAALLRLLPRVYRGEHTSSPLVETRRVRSVTLNAERQTSYADGDPLGPLPLRVDVAPAMLRVCHAAAAPVQ